MPEAARSTGTGRTRTTSATRPARVAVWSVVAGLLSSGLAAGWLMAQAFFAPSVQEAPDSMMQPFAVVLLVPVVLVFGVCAAALVRWSARRG